MPERGGEESAFDPHLLYYLQKSKPLHCFLSVITSENVGLLSVFINVKERTLVRTFAQYGTTDDSTFVSTRVFGGYFGPWPKNSKNVVKTMYCDL